jgi:hypothetical protein
MSSCDLRSCVISCVRLFKASIFTRFACVKGGPCRSVTISVVNWSGVNLTTVHRAVHLEMSFYVRVVDVEVRLDETSWNFSSEVIGNGARDVIDAPVQLVPLR